MRTVTVNLHGFTLKVSAGRDRRGDRLVVAVSLPLRKNPDDAPPWPASLTFVRHTNKPIYTCDGCPLCVPVRQLKKARRAMGWRS